MIAPVSAEPWVRPESTVGSSTPAPPSTALPATVPEVPASSGPAGPHDAPTARLDPVPAASAPPVGPEAAAAGFTPVPPDDSRDASVFEGFDDGAPRHGWVRGLVWTGLAVLVLGGLYTGAQWFYSDKVPTGTTVAGVDVGGMTGDAAEDELASTVGARAAEPVDLTAGDSGTTMDPAAAGLAFDAHATAQELTAFSMNPSRLWQHLFGGEAADPVVTVDDTVLDEQVETLHGSLDVAAVDGTVQFVDGAPSATDAADGAALVTDEAADRIVAGWLVTDGAIDLPTEPVAPEITQEETDAALEQAQTVVSAPVVVSVGGQDPELPAEVVAGAASYPAADGELALSLDGPTLVEAVVDRTNDLLTTADDAHFVFSGGKPVIEGGEPGTTIDPDALAAAVGEAATSDERTADVELTESDPEQSREALEELGVKEKISEFATPLTNDAVRTDNLRVGASKVDETLVLPGETFSLIDTLSPITIAGGYHASGIVQDGKHTEGVGGGLSQMATTTYNAGFFAGLEDVEHRQHSYWFTRYPAGREATIYVGALDMRFKNDTPYGVLMQSWVSGGQLHVATWSTKYYEVETSASPKTNVVPTTTVTHKGSDCEPIPAGNPGFSITNYRKVYLDGDLVKDEADHWTYKPDNEVVCE
ncbi:VanW family protein [Cellulosimicrobium arenosum]|uniref:VanW family protein n=1 Tax=Cellulosimicrobium arenosum TaxID=2708133 RepID=A0A927IZC6_9MICO|nr:VanW family protein [Cellulosimicrobium arenosum]